MASPTYGAHSWVDAVQAANSRNIAVPSGAASGEVMVIMMYREEITDTPTCPNFLKPSDGSAGFDNYPNSDHSLFVAWKRLTGADGGNYTISFSANNQWTEIACVRISGCVSSGNPFETDIDTNNVTSGTNTGNVAITTATADTLLLFAGTQFTGGTWTPSGYTERLDGTSVTFGTQALASAGASGNKSAACNGSASRMIGYLAALKSLSTDFDVKKASQFLTFY
jgi:hypothetical protein